MRILVDADACPVVDIAIRIAKENGIEIILYYDDSHITTKDYAKIIVVSKGPDAVDFALINDLKANDLVITQDYGVASMALAKNAYAINQNGLVYNDNNIEQLLMTRSIIKKAIKSSKSHIKGPKKRTLDDDKKFEFELNKLIGEVYDSRNISA